MQAIANGLCSGVVYAALAVGFGLLHAATGVLNFAYVVAFLVGGLVFASLNMPVPASATVACILAIASASLYAVGSDLLLVRSLEKRGARGGGLFLATLALYLASANLLAVFLSAQTRGISYAVGASDWFGLVTVGASQVAALAAYLVTAPVVYWLVKITVFGRRLRAFASDVELAATLGYDIRHLRTQALLAAGIIAGVAGILVTVDQGIAPYDGIDVFLFATAAWIVGGPRNLLGGLWAGLLLGVIRSVAAQAGAGAWVDGLPFLVLVLFILLTPERLRSPDYRADMPAFSREI